MEKKKFKIAVNSSTKNAYVKGLQIAEPIKCDEGVELSGDCKNDLCDVDYSVGEEGESGDYLINNEGKRSNCNKWSECGEGAIVSVAETFDKLDAGYYSIRRSNELGMYFLKKNVKNNKIYRLPNDATDLVLNDIGRFWTLEANYKKYDRVFRRNYLLYSAPGTGKTSLIALMCQDLIEKHDGIVFNLSSENEISMFVDAVARIRKIEPQRKIIAIIEDIDNYIGTSGEYTTSSLTGYILNVLDGNMKTDGVVIIATTNYIERLEERFKNRPSRFDRVIEFPLPNEESRRIFITKSVLSEDLEKIDVEKWVKETEGFTIDHINELILLFFIFGHTEEESFATIKEMVNNNSKLKNKTSVNKSGFGFEK